MAFLAALGFAGGALYASQSGQAKPPDPPPAPPRPTITSGPANGSTSTSTSATFAFTDIQSGVSFKCSLDGGGYGGCTSPKTYNGLSDGLHSFQVAAQNGGSALSYASNGPRSWTIDTTPPNYTLTFPADKGLYTASAWNSGCSPTGLCGSASDATGVQAVKLSIRQDSGNWWGGSSFNKTSEFFLNATLGSPGASSTTWKYAFALPADNTYTVRVYAIDTLGNQTSANKYVSASFTIDTTAPPPPTFKKTPNSQTNDTKAHFEYKDGEGGVKFQCSLDGTPYSDCGDSQEYKNLAQGAHTFCVKALDKAGNASGATCFQWTIGTGIGQNFTIGGNAIAPVYPGGPSVPIDLLFTNPNSSPITVSVTVTASATSNPSGCPVPGNFSVTQMTGQVTVPGSANQVPLSTLLVHGPGPTQWPAAAPHIQMLNNGNQNGCASKSVSMTYTGTGQG